MNEQEFIRQMKTQGVKLTDQQMKSEYRRYLKDPESFENRAKESTGNPFLEGLEGTEKSATLQAVKLPGKMIGRTKPAPITLPNIIDNTIGRTKPAPITLPNIIDNTIGWTKPAKPILLSNLSEPTGQAKIKQQYTQDDTISSSKKMAAPSHTAMAGGPPEGSNEYDAFIKSFGRAMGLDSTKPSEKIPPVSAETSPLDKGGWEESSSATDPTGAEAAAELAQLEKEWEALMKNPNATRQDFIDVFNAKKMLKFLTDAAKDKKGQVFARKLESGGGPYEKGGLEALTGLDSAAQEVLKKLGFSDQNGFEGVLNDALHKYDSLKYYSDPRAWIQGMTQDEVLKALDPSGYYQKLHMDAFSDPRAWGWTPEGQKEAQASIDPQPGAAPQATMSPEQAGDADGQNLPETQRFMGWKDKESNFDPNGVHADTLQKKIDSLKTLKNTADMLERSHAPAEAVASCRKQMETLARELDYTLPGLNGDYSDPTKMVDIKFNGKAVGNARNSGGTASGNLDDIVSGLGGKVSWGGNTATVRDVDGKELTTITMLDSQAIEKDKNGTIIKIYPVEDGKVQADIVDYAKRLGVPVSYYHDKNGVFHAYAQPEMKDAPVQVVRKEGDVYIDANVDFVGAKANEKFPGTDYTYAEVAYAGIVSKWNTGSSYSTGGETGNIKLHVNVSSNNPSDKNLIKKLTNQKAKTIKINIDDSSIMQDLGFTSHVVTLNGKDGIPALAGKVFNNAKDALSSKEYERLAYNWTIAEPGEMTLYTREHGPSIQNVVDGMKKKGTNISQKRHADVAAHEFGHLLGLGDAYAAFYRLGANSPDTVKHINDYGEMVEYTVPKDNAATDNIDESDIMRGGTRITDIDVAMLLDSWKNNEPEFFEKDQAQMDAYVANQKKSVIDFLKGLVK